MKTITLTLDQILEDIGKECEKALSALNDGRGNIYNAKLAIGEIAAMARLMKERGFYEN